ncbi:hypothetical protein BCR34DRAFT_480132 [Clohesyomyces aquaticus]|uniref:F-box domain-containing protein n=1 Tax=Clohesyomyces aquaticus TaxID=1231657 RepID=A0A1Y1ZV30_9PLEO|nr:hypothetical protein BCR34DRAFT_480132 [Clohesyomyces aquaticus]
MGLATLPTELVETIASHLSLPDFRCFRLTSPPLNRQSLQLFRSRFFRRRSITWTTEDLRCLLDISWHPDFGLALHDLVVDATPKYAIQLWDLKNKMYESRHDSGLKTLYWMEYDLLNEKADNSFRYWNETRHDQQTLTAIFQRLKQINSITFCYDGVHRWYGFGNHKDKYCESSQNEMSRPFVSTLAAIAASGILVHELSVHKERNHGAISVGRLESISPLLPRLDCALETLSALKLDLRDWRRPTEGFEPPPGKLPIAVRILSRCRNLRKLELSWFSTLERNMFTQAVKHCHLTTLEVCRLELLHVNLEDLMAFLGPSKKNLRDLSLTHVVLRDVDSQWPELLRRFATELHLQRLSFMSVFSHTSENVAFLDSTSEPPWFGIQFSGPKIREKLLEHAETLVIGDWGAPWHHASTAYPFENHHRPPIKIVE